MFFTVGCLSPCLAETFYVKPGGTGDGRGSWASATGAISAALAAAVAGDQIWVAAGTYGPISLKTGVKVYGGFAGTETAAAQSNPSVNVTTVDGGGSARCVSSVNNDGATVFRGFRITNGFAGSSNCGGAMELVNSQAIIVGCNFSRNLASFIGAGVCIDGGLPKFVNCKFFDHAPDPAGTSNPRPGTPSSGAVFVRDSATPTFVNCLFYRNQTEEGGAVGVLGATPTFINCTFVNNVSLVNPGGTESPGEGASLLDNTGQTIVRNSIVWYTLQGTAGATQIFNNPKVGGTTTITHSDIIGAWSGQGNISSDPSFEDAANDDYRLSGILSSSSPCKDTGSNWYLPADFGDLDWDGNTTEQIPFDLTGTVARVRYNTVDMGAYEWTKQWQQ
jgi:hypothetical protein